MENKIDTTKKVSLMQACMQVNKDIHNAHYVDWEKFGTALGFPDFYWGQQPDDAEKRITAYYVKAWNCTDTWVGIVAYFWDGSFVGYSVQEARKSGIDYYWVGREAVRQLRSYMQSEFDLDSLSYCDPDAELDEYSTFKYRDAVVDNEGVWDGEPVTVDRKATHELWEAQKPNSFDRALFNRLVVRTQDHQMWTIKAEEYHVRLRVDRPVLDHSQKEADHGQC